MTYTPGTYFCVGTHGFVPTVIKMATHSLVDHAGVITDTAGSIVEAMPGGVRISNISEYKGSYLLISSPEESTPEQRGIIVDSALHMVGVPYNDLAIVDDGLESLGVFWNWLASYASTDHELMCSEVVASCGAVAALNWMCGRKHVSEVTPGDLGRRPGMHRLTL